MAQDDISHLNIDLYNFSLCFCLFDFLCKEKYKGRWYNFVVSVTFSLNVDKWGPQPVCRHQYRNGLWYGHPCGHPQCPQQWDQLRWTPGSFRTRGNHVNTCICGWLFKFFIKIGCNTLGYNVFCDKKLLRWPRGLPANIFKKYSFLHWRGYPC